MSTEPRLDTLFQALADPTRRAMLSSLARGPQSVSDLAQPFDMALPSLLGHLRKLEAAGLIETRKDGRVRTCAIVPDALTPVRGWLDEQRALWEGRLDRLEDYVTRLMEERSRD
ncbi:winged helix-turn-helix transcriptional regulator [Rhodobacter sp. NTK016B]|uniref:ArsR/SmtB family transcription factor n=1 Tax=Rhodobacter sp. NTK016B TaxID=2759676 RepID=UPI001A905404|nr:metalloregulator ArsR/SmtB family transcription factor [Rhodobacter sp. NTK016B]MBN8292655.1 winged helix-turn-helix transcriptional regulator [Rhodobacter sp. NTK016B]